MDKELENLNIAKNRPLYLYQQPMFMLTVSVVLIEENGVILLKEKVGEKEVYRFPGGLVRASQETIQFSAVRQIKEQTGIILQKDALIPVDFRSSPERSQEGNVVDIGMVCILNRKELSLNHDCKWMEANFEDKCLDNKNISFYMDHNILLSRAFEIVCMMKNN